MCFRTPLAGFWKTCGIGLFYRNYRSLLEETRWLDCWLASVCLETRWLGSKTVVSISHGGPPAAENLRQCPLPSRDDALFSEQGPGIVVVVSCTKLPPPRIHLVPAYNLAAGNSRRSSLRVSDAGGSRRSYRNGRVDSAVAESTPFPKVVGWGNPWLPEFRSDPWPQPSEGVHR